MKFQVRIAILVTGLVSAGAQASSFNDVRDRIYAKPFAKVPVYENLPAIELGRAFLGLGGELVRRAFFTLNETTDFKEKRVKMLHPMGVCAEARWTIDQPSEVTGLLSQGTDVNAIVRMSAATAQTRWSPTEKRIFGLALKLFPTQNPDEVVETRNVFTLEGSKFKAPLHKLSS